MNPPCKDCTFYLMNEKNSHYGECWRYPPTFKSTSGIKDDRPRVFVLDWCGEFKERPKE